MRAAGGYDTPQNSLTSQNAAFPSDFVAKGNSLEKSLHRISLEKEKSKETDAAVFQAQQNNDATPRILLMGPRRSGKTSIFKVVFERMTPQETLFLESTVKSVQHVVHNSNIFHFKVWDFANSCGIETLDRAFLQGTHTLLFVIDAQDQPLVAGAMAAKTIQTAFKANSRIFFEIFVHKSDGLGETQKLEMLRDLSREVLRMLGDNGCGEANVNFYLSSIYDHSVFENISKVVQKLVPSVGALEKLMDIIVTNCRLDRAFLFDLLSRVYIASDSQPVDVQSFELTSDTIDLVIDLASIYQDAEEEEEEDDEEDMSSIIKVGNGRVLYLRQVGTHLALVCLMRADNLERQGLIEYNVHKLREALGETLRPSGGRTPRISILSETGSFTM